MARRAAQALGGALGGSTLALLVLWGIDEIHWRRIEHARVHRP
jgi:hypothetical protein